MQLRVVQKPAPAVKDGCDLIIPRAPGLANVFCAEKLHFCGIQSARLKGRKRPKLAARISL